jgi:LacI family transcriptional regulator
MSPGPAAGRGREAGQPVGHTIEDVAAAAGVSRSTASRALSGHPSVRAVTRQKVREAAERLGYQVDPVARALRAGSSGLIGLVLTNLMNASIQIVATTVQDIAHREGFEVLIATTQNDPAREGEIVRLLRSHRVDGVLVMGTGANTDLLNTCHAEGFPVVAIIRLPRGARTPSVVYADRDAAHQATAHLVEHGHRDIAFIGGPASTRSGRERYAGFASTLRHAGVPAREDLVFRGPFAPEFGSHATRALLETPSPPTAVVIANHESISGVLQVVAQRAVAVPDQLSIVGIEDNDVLRFWHPAITVVDTDPALLGERAIAALLGELRRDGPPVLADLPAGEHPVPGDVVPTRLVTRASVARLDR